MANIYYPNTILLLIPGLEAMGDYRRALQRNARDAARVLRLFRSHMLFVSMIGVSLMPTLITRRIIYGTFFESDYPPIRDWFWTSPALLPVLFSANHGLLSWTSVLITAILGLVLLWRRDFLFAGTLLLLFLAYYYFIASYPSWDGVSSFGNRFFVSLTSLFVIGLSAALDFFARLWKQSGRDFVVAAAFLGILELWNAGFIFQWGTQMISARGPVLWSEMVHNQYAVVPGRIARELENYFLRRKSMMQRIEVQDLQRLQRLAPQ